MSNNIAEGSCNQHGDDPAEVSQSKRHRPHERYTAIYGKLALRATSPAAKALVQGIFDDCTHWELVTGQRKLARSSQRVRAFHETLERLIADTLQARANFGKDGSVFRSLRDSEFASTPVTVQNFRAALEALKGLKLITHELAGVTWRDPNAPYAFRAASRLRATHWLQQRAFKSGVD